ncbi:MAG: hypothetical protein HY922_16930 [Elusimicrobia bacterium]|nr:hypothetical protein [Elusimicrobiota bacterium]
MAVILRDSELHRLLTHLNLPAELPMTAPARSRPPPVLDPDECQINPLADLFEGIDPIPGDDLSPA